MIKKKSHLYKQYLSKNAVSILESDSSYYKLLNSCLQACIYCPLWVNVFVWMWIWLEWLSGWRFSRYDFLKCFRILRILVLFSNLTHQMICFKKVFFLFFFFTNPSGKEQLGSVWKRSVTFCHSRRAVPAMAASMLASMGSCHCLQAKNRYSLLSHPNQAP